MARPKGSRGRLTPQQTQLVDEYLLCGNAAEAARRAGYSEAGSKVIWRTMKIPHVVAEIQRRLDAEMTSAEVLHRIGRLARESGDEATRLKALELLGKKHKLFTDKVEHEIGDSLEKLVLASMRAEEPAGKEKEP